MYIITVLINGEHADVYTTTSIQKAKKIAILELKNKEVIPSVKEWRITYYDCCPNESYHDRIITIHHPDLVKFNNERKKYQLRGKNNFLNY